MWEHGSVRGGCFDDKHSRKFADALAALRAEIGTLAGRGESRQAEASLQTALSA